MAIYAVGDLQGCYSEFVALLDFVHFKPKKDELWLAGDIVNRGPDSLSCLRLAKKLNAKVVLGNHDLHLLACYYSKHLLKKKDTLADIFEAKDCEELMEWLRRQPLLRVDEERGFVMSHAGLPHIWGLAEAKAKAQEVESVLSGTDLDALTLYFEHMYGNTPAMWSEGLQGVERLRVITNYFTRMRFIDASGALDFKAKQGVATSPSGYQPWFEFKQKQKFRIVFGHWAALEGKTSDDQFQAIDTGCVWGGPLTALNLETLERTSWRNG
jgi:bis(5'-nucleosyl)-tetraphosphatase (symmetrical)